MPVPEIAQLSLTEYFQDFKYMGLCIIVTNSEFFEFLVCYFCNLEHILSTKADQKAYFMVLNLLTCSFIGLENVRIAKWISTV